MRWVVGLFGAVCGAIVVAIVARYGFKSADNELDGYITATMFGIIAAGGLGGHAVAARVWRSSRVLGVLVGVVAVAAFAVNLSNSLGFIAGRGDKHQAEQARVLQSLRDDRAELTRITKGRETLPSFVPTGAAAVKAAEAAVAAAEATRIAECDKRGTFCRQRETDEAARRTELSVAMTNRALTERAASLEADADRIRQRLAATPAVGTENPQAQAISRLFKLPEADAASYQQFAVALIVELLIVASLVAWEVMGGDKRLRATAVIEPVPLGREPDPKPEPKREPPEEPVSTEPVTEPLRIEADPKPKLVSSEAKPAASVRAMLSEILEPSPGNDVEIGEVFVAYAALCTERECRALTPEQFVDPLRKFTERTGIKSAHRRGTVYLRNVRIADQARAANGEGA